MNPPRKRPELLLAAAALLVAAAALLAIGAKRALAPEQTQPETATQVNPFEAARQTGTPAQHSTGAGGSYIVGYTGIVAVQPGGEEALSSPNDGGALSPQLSQPPQRTAVPPQVQQPVEPASYPVNLNTATQAQLEALPGIGPVKAQAILAWRMANGGFANANQLLQVNGIGQKTLEGLLPYITW